MKKNIIIILIIIVSFLAIMLLNENNSNSNDIENKQNSNDIENKQNNELITKDILVNFLVNTYKNDPKLQRDAPHKVSLNKEKCLFEIDESYGRKIDSVPLLDVNIRSSNRNSVPEIKLTCANSGECINRSFSKGRGFGMANLSIYPNSPKVAKEVTSILNGVKSMCANSSINNKSSIRQIVFSEDSTNLTDSLIIAVNKNNIEKVKKLILQGADINGKDSDGLSILFIAARQRSNDIIELLLNKGVDINQLDSNGDTLLHWTVSNDDLRGIKRAKLLVNLGINNNIRNKDGETAIDIAKRLRKSKWLLEVANNSLLFEKDDHVYMCGQREVCEVRILSPGTDKTKVEFIKSCNPGLVDSFFSGQKAWIPNNALGHTSCK